MPSHFHQQDGEPPGKRVKIDTQPGNDPIATPSILRKSLQQQNQESLIGILTALRNKLTIKPGEGVVSPQDGRFTYLQTWLDASPGAEEIFNIWSGATTRQLPLISIVVSSLASIVTLLSSHYTFHSLGQPIVKSVLSSPWIQHFNGYLSSSHNDLVLATLKLLNAVSTFAGGREQRALMDVFAWESKALPKLLTMRRRTKSGHAPDALDRPDIRTLFILLMLSFVDSTSSSSVKLTLLEQHRDAIASIFKGLVGDPYPVVRKVLEVSWSGIWSDARVKRTAKIGVFNESCLAHIVKLYDRSQPEGQDGEDIPADLVHHFLLAICTRPHIGLCFRDRGWYPRESSETHAALDEAADAGPKSGRIHNRILANLLKSLKGNDDARQQELTLKILASCPELVAGYWPAAALTLEPRLSSKWIANISLFGSIISLPIPEWSFYLPNSTLYQPTPPPLSSLSENILPSVNIRAHISRGLQSNSALVQHCTALALAKCLDKYARVLDAMHRVEVALEEDAQDGQWSRRRRELEREIRRRVPDFQVIVAVSQQHKQGDSAMNRITLNSTQIALSAESSARLLRLYHSCLPMLVEETRFDVGKLVQTFLDDSARHEESTSGLYALRQLHILRLLSENDQFVWSGKTGNSTHLYVLLTQHSKTNVPEIRTAIESLLRRVLSTSILFQHDSEEIHAWLDSLPVIVRPSSTESPDGAILEDEQAVVIAFLDDCVQRCLKTPYRYLDELGALSAQSNEGTANAFCISPLAITVVEQLRAKLSAKLLTASATLTLASFMRRLLISLAGRVTGFSLLRRIAQSVSDDFIPERLPQDHPVISAAIEHEVDVLSESMKRIEGRFEAISLSDDKDPAVQEFLENIEKLPQVVSESETVKAAAELVDWLRLINRPLSPGELLRLVRAVEKLHKPTVAHLWQYLDPRSSPLQRDEFVALLGNLRDTVPFDCWLLHVPSSSLASIERRQVAARSALLSSQAHGASSAIRFICHRLQLSSSPREMLYLASSVIQAATRCLAPRYIAVLKEQLFSSASVQSLCLSSREDSVLEGLEELLRTCVDPAVSFDLDLVSAFAAAARAAVCNDFTPETLRVARAWTPYMAVDDMFAVLDRILTAPFEQLDDSNAVLLDALVKSVQRALAQADSAALTENRLQDLITLFARAPSLCGIESVISAALDTYTPLGLTGEQPAHENRAIHNMSSLALQRWRRREQARGWCGTASTFINQSLWTKDTAAIVTKMAHLHPASREALWKYLTSSRSTELETEQLAPCIRTCLDNSLLTASNATPEIWAQHFERLLQSLLNADKRSEDSACTRTSLLFLFQHFSTLQSSFANLVIKRVESLSKKRLNADLILLGEALSRPNSEQGTVLRSHTLDLGLKWAAHSFAGPDELDSAAIHALGLLGKETSVKAHLFDPVVSAVVHNRLSDAAALDFVRELLPRSQMKPVLVNRHLQSIIQHSSFRKYAHPSSDSRSALVHLVYTLFNMHPSNTCQPSHISPLTMVFGHSQSKSDLQLLDVFRLYEDVRKTSAAPFFTGWSQSDGNATTSIRTIQELDPSRVFRTCLMFPVRRRDVMVSDSVRGLQMASQQLYEPIYALSLCAQMLADGAPTSVSDWTAVFRTNIVSLVIRALSSEDADIRRLAIAQLSAISSQLEKQDLRFQERSHVNHILSLLRDTVKYTAADNTPERIPSYTTLLLAHALRAIFYPANFIYPLTARFLLQRPELDISDIPLLYSMLYSASDDWKKERGWMLKFLADGMLGGGALEWKVFRRRRTWDLLASLWQSGGTDRALRTGILEILLNLTCSRHIVTSLVIRSALLAWMEVVLLRSQEGLRLLWLKVLENILLVADAVKLETATNEAWRASLGRCLSSLLEHAESPPASSLVLLESRVLIRLAQLPGPPIPLLSSILSRCVSRLEAVEKSIELVPTPQPVQDDNSPLLHTSYTANSDTSLNDVEKWGRTVVALWRTSMLREVKDPVWDAMTVRMLLWRSIAGDRCIEGEWVRKETVDALIREST